MLVAFHSSIDEALLDGTPDMELLLALAVFTPDFEAFEFGFRSLLSTNVAVLLFHVGVNFALDFLFGLVVLVRNNRRPTDTGNVRPSACPNVFL